MTDEWGELEGAGPTVRVNGLELVLSPPRHGWVDVSLRLGDFELICSASTVLNDPLAELLDLASFARDGHSGFRRACFWLEPEGYAVDLKSLNASDVMLTILHDKTFVPPMANRQMKQVYRCVLARVAASQALRGAIGSVLATPSAMQDSRDELVVERLRAAYAELKTSRPT
jgi:hypothetical protein